MEGDAKTNGIILLRRPTKESHGSITAFTKQFGKVRLTAMGLYKPTAKLSATLLPGNLVYLTLSKGRNWHVTGAKVDKEYAHAFFEPRLLYLSSIVRELLIELFPDEEANDTVYEHAIECFDMLVSDKHSIIVKELIVYRFILAVFNVQGLMPDFSVCSVDGRKLANGEGRYWKQDRGLICEQCKSKERTGLMKLPTSIADIPAYTTADTLTAGERGAITTMVQDIYSHEHKSLLHSLQAWQNSL